jgi:hypothetical protein
MRRRPEEKAPTKTTSIPTAGSGNQGSREGYRDISGRGAFRRFKDVLARWPDELERWYRVSNERERGRG